MLISKLLILFPCSYSGKKRPYFTLVLLWGVIYVPVCINIMSTKLVNLEIGYNFSIEHTVPLKEGKFVQQGKTSINNSDFVLFKYVLEN